MWSEASLLLTITCLCPYHRLDQCRLPSGDLGVSEDHILPEETGPPLAQAPGHAGRKVGATLSGVKVLVSWLAPPKLIWAPSFGSPPKALLHVYVRVGGAGGVRLGPGQSRGSSLEVQAYLSRLSWLPNAILGCPL